MTQITTTNRICEHLEKYVYDRVWNEPYTEYRTYIRPALLNSWVVNTDKVTGVKTRVEPEPVAGFFSGRYSRIILPPFDTKNVKKELEDWLPTDRDKYFVYIIPARFFGSIKIDVKEWMLLSEYCNENCTDLNLFTDKGVILNRGAIYIRQGDANDCMLLAVSADMFGLLTGGWNTADKVIFGKYHDSDGVADNKIVADIITKYHTTSGVVRPWDDSTYLLYNGKLVTNPNYLAYVRVNSYIEGVKDDDIVGYFDVPCTGDNAPIYTDEKDEFDNPGTGSERIIVHIPKSINPNYYLITPNTCDLFLIPTDENTTGLSGIYLYPCGRERYYHQMTHNDFSIDMEGIRRVAAANGFTEYAIRVYVRTHDKKSVFVRDNNYIDMLYNCSDHEILKFLLGDHTWQQTNTPVTSHQAGTAVMYWYEDSTALSGWSCIPEYIRTAEEFAAAKVKYGNLYMTPSNSLKFWKADHLEDCKYANALVRRRGYKYQDPSDQCSICRNCSLCTTEQKTEVTGISCQRFVRYPANQCSVCGLHDRCDLEISDYECPYYRVRGVRDYVDILGYFHVLGLIGKRVWHFQVKTPGTRNVVVYAPLALAVPELQVSDYYPIVYHNGYRIDQDRITISSTNRYNQDVEEMTHNTGSLSMSTLVIQSNFATRLMITIAPKYHVSEDFRIDLNKDYHVKKSDGTYRKAVIVASDEEYEELDWDKKVEVDYIGQNRINKDESSEYILSDDEIFLSGKVYYAKVGDDEYEVMTPGTDYVVGMTISEDVYTYYPVLHEIDTEFYKNDVIAVEVYDNRGDGQITKHVRPIQEEPYDIEVKTEDQWKLYHIIEETLDDGTTVGYKYKPVTEVGAYFFDRINKILTLTALLETKPVLLVEGPLVRVRSITKEIDDSTFGSLGKELKTSEEEFGDFALDDALVFLNNKRLVRDLDYSLIGFQKDADGTKHQSYGYIQNMSYLWAGEIAKQTGTTATIDFIRTCTTSISSYRGFMVGRDITWMGQAPFWFDELSTLTVDGKFCSHFQHSLGAVKVTDNEHRNGSPYEINTACSSRVLDILGCQDEMPKDMLKISMIRDFFEVQEVLPIMETIIPHSHMIYSTYLEAICEAYLTTSFDFNATITDKTAFEAQFAAWNYLKNSDIAYKMSKYDLGFVDVYPIYHRAVAKNREDFNKLRYLNNMLAPEDHIKHKDATHE